MWITISSGVLSFSFIFGPTMSKQLQAILLLFVVHPFDVGDTLMMDGNFVTVEEMSLNKVQSHSSTLTATPLLHEPQDTQLISLKSS